MIEKPFFLLKPYFSQHADVFTQIIDNHGIKIDGIYKVDDWGNLARKLYEITAKNAGPSWQVGLEEHIHIVNWFFGNRALLVTVNETLSTKTVKKNLDIKKEVRDKMLAGPRTNDMILMVNLDKSDVDNSCNAGVRGKLGIMNENIFVPITDHGCWDNYYFKYLHTPDDLENLKKEYKDITDTGILKESNRISLDDYYLMVKKLKTFITPAEMLSCRRC